MASKQQKIKDIQTAVANWVRGFKEPVGFDTLAKGLAAHWHEEVWCDELHGLLTEMVQNGQIKDAGHWCYEC